tara:strand:+ start:425 stop:664 length:240 start_codon:yes stop_codon:yes gene_type:complete
LKLVGVCSGQELVFDHSYQEEGTHSHDLAEEGRSHSLKVAFRASVPVSVQERCADLEEEGQASRTVVAAVAVVEVLRSL